MDAAPAERAALTEADGDLAELNRLEGQGLALTQSGDLMAAQTLLRRAAAALLEAKSGGRNRTVTAAQLAA
jgi:GGDEF domain-containing protein